MGIGKPVLTHFVATQTFDGDAELVMLFWLKRKIELRNRSFERMNAWSKRDPRGSKDAVQTRVGQNDYAVTLNVRLMTHAPTRAAGASHLENVSKVRVKIHGYVDLSRDQAEVGKS